MGLYEKFKQFINPPLLDPRVGNSSVIPKFDVKNTVMPDKTTTNPSTQTGYNWAKRYFNSDNSINKNAFITNTTTSKEVTPTKLSPTPTLMPSSMKGNISPTPSPQIQTPKLSIPTIPTNVMDVGTTKKQQKVYSDLYDASQKYGDVYNVPKEILLSNSDWEHRNNKDWGNGIYKDNIWYDPVRKKGEESYGPGQINMDVFGPNALKKGSIKETHPLYITPDDAKDVWKSMEWMAKKFSMEAKTHKLPDGTPDWSTILQNYNSREENRGKNVIDLMNNTDFIK